MSVEELAKDAQNCRACPDIKKWASSLIKSAFGSDSSATRNPTSDMPCPPDAAELGSSTWTFLHTMSVYYPERPNKQQQQDMNQFISLFSKFFPCKPCAEHLQEHLTKNPPSTESREALSTWMCQLHNEVNERLGKPYFDCSKVMERWRTGCSDNQ